MASASRGSSSDGSGNGSTGSSKSNSSDSGAFDEAFRQNLSNAFKSGGAASKAATTSAVPAAAAPASGAKSSNATVTINGQVSTLSVPPPALTACARPPSNPAAESDILALLDVSVTTAATPSARKPDLKHAVTPNEAMTRVASSVSRAVGLELPPCNCCGRDASGCAGPPVQIGPAHDICEAPRLE